MGDLEAFDLEVKRFYVPGQSVVGMCPRCGGSAKRDLSSDYLSYPQANEPIEVTLRHLCPDKDPHGDGHEFVVRAVVEVRVRTLLA